MLYYIIPPLIIIIGLAILVSFLFRKINQIPPAEISVLSESGKKSFKNFWSGFGRRFSQIELKMLEKLVQRFKLFSLKFHNCCQNWFQSIKKKREQVISRKVEVRKEEKKEESRTDTASEIKTIPGTESIKIKEIRSYPMISKTAVQPEREEAVKNRLEEALIERIAANPNDIEAYERLADYYIERENYGEALECFRHVLKLSPVHRKARISVRRLERMLKK